MLPPALHGLPMWLIAYDSAEDALAPLLASLPHDVSHDGALSAATHLDPMRPTRGARDTGAAFLHDLREGVSPPTGMLAER